MTFDKTGLHGHGFNDSFGKLVIFCPKIPLGDVILNIIFKDSSEFLVFRNSQKFERAVEVRFFVLNMADIMCTDEALP